jgi:hypothetical protein
MECSKCKFEIEPGTATVRDVTALRGIDLAADVYKFATGLNKVAAQALRGGGK